PGYASPYAYALGQSGYGRLNRAVGRDEGGRACAPEGRLSLRGGVLTTQRSGGGAAISIQPHLSHQPRLTHPSQPGGDSQPRRCDIVVVGAPETAGLDAGGSVAGGSGGNGEPGGAGVLEGGDVIGVAEGQADVVEALHQAPAGVAVDLEGRLEAGRSGPDDAVVQVHDDLGGRPGLDGVLQGGDRSLGQDHREQAGLGGVA